MSSDRVRINQQRNLPKIHTTSYEHKPVRDVANSAHTQSAGGVPYDGRKSRNSGFVGRPMSAGYDMRPESSVLFDDSRYSTVHSGCDAGVGALVQPAWWEATRLVMCSYCMSSVFVGELSLHLSLHAASESPVTRACQVSRVGSDNLQYDVRESSPVWTVGRWHERNVKRKIARRKTLQDGVGGLRAHATEERGICAGDVPTTQFEAVRSGGTVGAALVCVDELDVNVLAGVEMRAEAQEFVPSGAGSDGGVRLSSEINPSSSASRIDVGELIAAVRGLSAKVEALELAAGGR